MAYLISPLLIYSNLSIKTLFYFRAVTPSSLKHDLDRPPSVCVVGQDDDKDFEGELEEDPPESYPEIRLKLDIDYDSNLVPPSSSLYPLYFRQPAIVGHQHP